MNNNNDSMNEFIDIDCPKDVYERAFALQLNGIHGFQAPNLKENSGLKNYFVICYVGGGINENETYDSILNRLKEESGSRSVAFGDYIGRDYVKIHWSEYSLIENVFNALLKIGISFTTRNHAEAHFNANVDHSFTFEEMERKSIAMITQLLHLMHQCSMIDDSFYEPWNYITDEGRSFCLNVMQKREYYMYRYEKERENYYEWPLFQSYDKKTLKGIISSNFVIEKPSSSSSSSSFTNNEPLVSIPKEEDDNLCMICLEREANTMVLPCEHTVVCKTCSLQLERDESMNRDHCVKCRHVIEHKLY